MAAAHKSDAEVATAVKLDRSPLVPERWPSVLAIAQTKRKALRITRASPNERLQRSQRNSPA